MSMIDHKTGLTLATKITIVRLLMTPVFVLLAVYYIDSVQDGQPNAYLRWATATVFLVTCSTDALDGYFARSRNARTRLGTMLDPLADKFLLLSGLIVLTGAWGRCYNLESHIPIWYVLLVISRDVLLTIGAVIIHMVKGHMEVKPRITGKVATVFQMMLICWVLFALPPGIFKWVLWVAAAFTLFSLGQYIADGVRQLERGGDHAGASPPLTV